jgi:hypothetical protein
MIFFQINHFCDFKYNYPPWHLVKTTSNHINDYKMVCNMQCIFVINVNLNENKNVVVFVTWKVVQGQLDTT